MSQPAVAYRYRSPRYQLRGGYLLSPDIRYAEDQLNQVPGKTALEKHTLIFRPRADLNAKAATIGDIYVEGVGEGYGCDGELWSLLILSASTDG